MPASRMLSAISLGVFCRTAPSTSAIMRSRKVEPCAAVIRTRSQSDVTRVPPVTAERSPPLSRITGADSPVIADSSTDATPSMTSPSLGIRSPASTSTKSSGLSAVASTRSKLRELAACRRLALASVRVRRSASAWALPRHSATASAKLANSTVNHNQTVIWPENSALEPTTVPLPKIRSRKKKIVVSTETISTQNMTGFLTRVRGSSLRNDAQIAGTISERSRIASGRTWRLISSVGGVPKVGEMSVIWDTLRKFSSRRRESENSRGTLAMTDISPTFGTPPTELIRRHVRPLAILDRSLIVPAIWASFKKLDPRTLVKNPVMFCVEIVSVLTTVFFLRDLFVGGGKVVGSSALFSGQITVWLWFTVLFANFAEAVAEGRGKAQADTLRRTRTETKAKRIEGAQSRSFDLVDAAALKSGDLVLVETGDLIPSDGEVVEGVASVDESAITGESAPVIRESGGDRSAVTGGTRVTSDWLKVRITAAQGSTFLDRMIALVEGAVRQKTPNEIALNILLAGMTLIFVFATVTIPSFASYAGGAVSIVVLSALFVCLIPTTIGALLSAIGIAGMDRLVRFNVLAMSGRAVEAAGDVDTLLLDKTGTITLGNRQATEFLALPGVEEAELG